jgi:hypothetical protein
MSMIGSGNAQRHRGRRPVDDAGLEEGYRQRFLSTPAAAGTSGARTPRHADYDSDRGHGAEQKALQIAAFVLS